MAVADDPFTSMTIGDDTNSTPPPANHNASSDGPPTQQSSGAGSDGLSTVPDLQLGTRCGVGRPHGRDANLGPRFPQPGDVAAQAAPDRAAGDLRGCVQP